MPPPENPVSQIKSSNSQEENLKQAETKSKPIEAPKKDGLKNGSKEKPSSQPKIKAEAEKKEAKADDTTNDKVQDKPSDVDKPETNKEPSPKKASSEESGRSALPSLKATQKDRSKNASIIERQHKMQLLVEVLKLLDIYKAHSLENKFQQWSMVQDALEKQELGSKYRRMDKSYCFRKKVLNAVNSWIDWARVRGYPAPHTLVKHPRDTWKFPAFLELLYKIYNESQDAAKRTLSKGPGQCQYNEESKADDEYDDESERSAKDDEISINSASPENSNRAKSDMVDAVAEDENETDDAVYVASVIQAVSTQANVSGDSSVSGSIRNYLKTSALVQKEKTKILSLKRTAIQAELDDRDLARLEDIEAKISNCASGSALHEQYSLLKDRCISRLERRA